MDWAQIREEYRHAKKQRGLTQKKIAEAGGLSGQNVVSKFLRNQNLGPSVEIMVKAIEGLGLSVSEFFARVEQRARGEDVDFLQGSYSKVTTIHANAGGGKAFILDTVVEALQNAKGKDEQLARGPQRALKKKRMPTAR